MPFHRTSASSPPLTDVSTLEPAGVLDATAASGGAVAACELSKDADVDPTPPKRPVGADGFTLLPHFAVLVIAGAPNRVAGAAGDGFEFERRAARCSM